MKSKFIIFFVITFLLLSGCKTTGTAAPGTIPENSKPSEQIKQQEQINMGLMITREAATYMRTPYSSPPKVPASFDCSSFVSHVYGQFGYKLPTATSAFGNVGKRIEWKDAVPGDLLIFAREKGSSTIDHVAMLWKKSDSGTLAGSWVIHAASINTGTSMQRGNPDTKTGIVITQLGLRGDGIIENEYFYQRFMYCARVE